MKALSALLGLVVVVSTCATVQAAMLEPIQGGVRINRGTGYVLVNSVAELKSGDRVIVERDGSARLVYSDCCSVEAGPGTLLTVRALSPCGAKDEPYQGRACKVARPMGANPALGLANVGLLGGVAAGGRNPGPPPFIPPACISNC